MAVRDEQKSGSSLGSSRFSVSKGLVTIGSATILLFIVSALLDPASVSSTSFSGMLPVAAVLAIAGLGQMLVVQQGGIDLSVAGGISLALVIVTHIPDGEARGCFRRSCSLSCSRSAPVCSTVC